MRIQIRNSLSHPEHQTLQGVINSLQCNRREALRIAIYELGKSGHKAAASLVSFASKSNKEKRHTGRKTKIEIRLPKKRIPEI